ncbi:MAG: DUF5063 domain-containing protein [Marinilabiliales bacterium]|nr:MAG: DUF5063 domain-containing protein [Marinilabiliales bacterium]
MEENFDHIVYSKDVLEFVTVAAEYCGYIETFEEDKTSDFLSRSQKILSLLYLKTMLLPEIEAIEEETEKFVTEFDWIRISEKVASRLGEHDLFVEVPESAVLQPDDISSVSLSEIFADIYQDLKDFISLYQMGNHDTMNDALFFCKLNFEQYWGQRLLVTMTAIHNLLHGAEDIDNEE